ncbi:hypothetical protein NDU88_010289 [Pleurodeles waltl]|uniref:Uncharacterized protein n=1 Tax=Pleurodeles waltl TaxID=8319 RepID=A0AAV7PYE2_PLEWA|nr:hypothetical protein NDU88_010289 [Pleurodeles waltl]
MVPGIHLSHKEELPDIPGIVKSHTQRACYAKGNRVIFDNDLQVSLCHVTHKTVSHASGIMPSHTLQLPAIDGESHELAQDGYMSFMGQLLFLSVGGMSPHMKGMQAMFLSLCHLALLQQHSDAAMLERDSRQSLSSSCSDCMCSIELRRADLPTCQVESGV